MKAPDRLRYYLSSKWLCILHRHGARRATKYCGRTRSRGFGVWDQLRFKVPE